MTPTRELALQIFREGKKFCKPLQLSIACIYGGSGISEQIAELKRGAEIIVCTPGECFVGFDTLLGVVYKVFFIDSQCCNFSPYGRKFVQWRFLIGISVLITSLERKKFVKMMSNFGHSIQIH